MQLLPHLQELENGVPRIRYGRSFSESLLRSVWFQRFDSRVWARTRGAHARKGLYVPKAENQSRVRRYVASFVAFGHD